jgi:RNA polymerase sigma-70 factor (family 1)
MDDDRQLLLQVAKGDRLAFKRIYDHYWNDMYALAISFLKSSYWAQDILQDLFLKIWIKRESLSSVAQFRPYIFIMLRNELITALRSKARYEQLYDKYRQQIPPDFLLPDNRLIINELEQFIREAIMQLPPTQSLLIDLTRNQGLSHEEIADRMGIAKKTVSNTLTKALNNIRNYLREHGERFSFLTGALGCWLLR